MEFGLFTEFPSPPGVTEAAAFDDSLAQMKAAEAFGFDAVWLAEIHFQRDRSVLAAPSSSPPPWQRARSAIGIAVQAPSHARPPTPAPLAALLEWILSPRCGTPGRSGHAF